ncbi:putative protein prenylyltransferase [Blattamonas nauphoetae]|uniref:Signal recognition particle subunit SRP72 n=1 Tax=Blattamonas nauphoetae TaxID=2049346 RepID=A0ABQ9YL91_9EUKA|nr:putative protein prenylyltransferase [Blattamonas nauphoetae]
MDTKKLNKLFQKIGQFAEDEEYEEIIPIADEILKEDATNADALKCKLLALLHTNQNAEVLDITKDQSQFVFERAYALYRLQNYQEASQIVDKIVNPPLNIQLLAAQLAFRLEDYHKSADLFEKLLQLQPDNEEIKVNLAAAYSMCKPEQAISLQSQTTKKKEEFYEGIFNQACARVFTGNYQEALRLLDESERLYREDNKDEAPGMIEKDLAPITAQRGYIYARLGKIGKARAIFAKLVTLKLSDQALVGVNWNNHIVLMGGKVDSVAIRKFRNSTPESVILTKMNGMQREAVLTTKFLLSINSRSFEQARESLALLAPASQPVSSIAGVMQIALRLSDKKTTDQEDVIAAYLAQNGGDKSHVALIQAGHLLSEKKNEEALRMIVDHVSPALLVTPPMLGLISTIRQAHGCSGITAPVSMADALKIWEAVASAKEKETEETNEARKAKKGKGEKDGSAEQSSNESFQPTLGTLLTVPTVTQPASFSFGFASEAELRQNYAALFHLSPASIGAVLSSLRVSKARADLQHRQYQESQREWEFVARLDGGRSPQTRLANAAIALTKVALKAGDADQAVEKLKTCQALDAADADGLEGAEELLKGFNPSRKEQRREKKKDPSGKKKKVKAMRHPPKNFNPQGNPDPNRWVSRKVLQERGIGKRKGRKMKAEATYGKGISQGSAEVAGVYVQQRTQAEIEQDKMMEKLKQANVPQAKKGGKGKRH